MNFPKIDDIKNISNSKICENIIQFEKKLFDLKFKKATRQPFKSHEIKDAKRKIAQLKTILTQRLSKLDQTKINSLISLDEK